MNHIHICIYSSFLFFSFFIISIKTSPVTTSYYWKNRSLSCEYYNTSKTTRCVLNIPQFIPSQNPNCFEELDENNMIMRVYCGLGCEESDEITLISKKPQWNHHCNMFYTYNFERRRRDWYLWRSGTCLNTSIIFDISCGTHKNPKHFYYQNQHLFEYEDAQQIELQ